MSFASQRKRIRKRDATVVVNNRSEFLTAIRSPDTIIWIPNDVTITIGRGEHDIGSNVIIASNRNLGNGTGGLIKTDSYHNPTFFASKDGVRITGLRFQGPRTDYFNPSSEDELDEYTACGIHFQGKGGIVDNCEIYGWTGFGVGFGTVIDTTQGWVHHNKMHHCQMDGLGYPIESFNGIQLIEWNYFSYYRHVVAGFGYPSNGYEARFNVVGPPSQAIAHFAFDMHRLGEQDNIPDSNNTGGKYLNIHHNVFELISDSAVSNQGKPVKYTRVVNNWTADSADGGGEVFYTAYPDTARIHDNNYQAAKEGRAWLNRMKDEIPLSNGVPSPSKWESTKTLPASTVTGTERTPTKRTDGTDTGRR